MRPFLPLLLAACAHHPAPVADPRAEAAEAVVRAFVDGFDQHEVEAMLAFATPDVQWRSVAGATVAIEVDGADQLRAAMADAWREDPTARWTLEDVLVVGTRVATHEVVTSQAGGAARSRRSLGVYELDEGRIARVWYWPMEPKEAR